MKLYAVTNDAAVEIPQGTDEAVRVDSTAKLELRWPDTVFNRRLIIRCNEKTANHLLESGQFVKISSAGKLAGTLTVTEKDMATGEIQTFSWKLDPREIAPAPPHEPAPEPVAEPASEPAPEPVPAPVSAPMPNVAELEALVAELEARKVELDADLKSRKARVEELNANIAGLQSRHDALKADNLRLSGLRGGIRDLESELKAAEMACQDKRALLAEKEQASRELDAPLDALDQQIGRREKEIQARRTALAALNEQRHEAEQALGAALRDCFSETASLPSDRTERALGEAEDGMIALSDRLNLLNGANAALRAKNEWLDEANRKLEQLSGEKIEMLKKQLQKIFESLDRVVDMDADIERNVGLAMEALSDDAFRARLKRVEDGKAQMQSLLDQSQALRNAIFDEVADQIEK